MGILATNLLICSVCISGAGEGEGGAPENEGPPEDHRTVISPAESFGPEGLEVAPDALREPGATAASVLGRLPGLMTTELGGAGGLTRLYVRGAEPDQLRVFVDDIPLERADGGPVDLSELPLFEAGRLTVWRNHAPMGYGGGIGGALGLRSAESRENALTAMVQVGAFHTGDLALRGVYASPGARWGASVGVGVLSSRGDFPWRDDGGTLFEPGDDQWAVRANNDIRRFSGLATGNAQFGRCALRLVDHLLFQERGVPGSAALPASRARHTRATHMAGGSLRCLREGGSYWEGRLSFRWQRDKSEDPLGEVYHVPSEALRTALAPHGAALGSVQLLPWLSLRFFGEATLEDYDLENDHQPWSEAEEQRSRVGLAAGFHVRAAPFALSLDPRLRLDIYNAREEGRRALTWQITARWRGLAAYGLQLRAGAGSGFRAPSLYELHGDGLWTHPNPDLRPEGATSVSAGGRWWMPGLPPAWRLGLELDGFGVRARDLIQWRRNTLWSVTAENVEGASILGVDGSVHVDVLRHLRATWFHSTLATTIHSERAAHDGRPLPLRPTARNTGRLAVYTRDSEGSELGIYSEIARTSSNTVDQAGLVVLPGRQVVNLGVTARWMSPGALGSQGTLVGGLAIMDLLDAAPMDLLGYPLPGRRWSIRVAWTEAVF